MTSENTISRRGLFMKLGILFNGLVATLYGTDRALSTFLRHARTRKCLPILGALGRVNEFPEGRRGWPHSPIAT